MRKHKLDHVLTEGLLKSYTQAAMGNAVQLLEEAQLLLSHGHHARAYFLAVAAIEECGKAYLTFDARGRNLNDSRISRKVQKTSNMHDAKIRAALTSPIIELGGDQKGIMEHIQLMVSLTSGREPAMYTDIRGDASSINEPSKVVSTRNGEDCVRLAVHALRATAQHLAEKTPHLYTAEDNEWYLLDDGTLQKMTSADFAEYMVWHLEAGERSFTKLFLGYYRDHYVTKAPFRRPAAIGS